MWRILGKWAWAIAQEEGVKTDGQPANDRPWECGAGPIRYQPDG